MEGNQTTAPFVPMTLLLSEEGWTGSAAAPAAARKARTLLIERI